MANYLHRYDIFNWVILIAPLWYLVSIILQDDITNLPKYLSLPCRAGYRHGGVLSSNLRYKHHRLFLLGKSDPNIV